MERCSGRGRGEGEDGESQRNSSDRVNGGATSALPPSRIASRFAARVAAPSAPRHNLLLGERDLPVSLRDGSTRSRVQAEGRTLPARDHFPIPSAQAAVTFADGIGSLRVQTTCAASSAPVERKTPGHSLEEYEDDAPAIMTELVDELLHHIPVWFRCVRPVGDRHTPRTERCCLHAVACTDGEALG